MPVISILRHPAPANVVPTAKAKGVRVTCDQIVHPWFDRLVMDRYGSSADASADINVQETIVAKGEEQRALVDTAELTKGVTYWYRAYWIDDYGNQSYKAAAVSVVYRGANSGDVEPGAVLPSHTNLGDPENKVYDSNCIDLAEWVASVPGLQTISTSLLGEASNRLYAGATVGGSSIQMVRSMPVRAGKKYYASIYAGSHNAVSATVAGVIIWYSRDGAGVETQLSQTVIGTGTTTGFLQFAGVFEAPANARRARLAITKSSAGSASPSLGAPLFRKAVEDFDVDPTLPATPTIALAGYGDDFDKDGTMDSGLLATITHPNTGVEIGDYIVQVQRADASGGPWSDWDRFTVAAEDVADSLTSLRRIKANARKWFRARVRAVAKLSGRKGAWTGYTAAVQPTTAAGYAGQAAPQPNVPEVIANGYVITWGLGSLDPALYKETEVTIGGVVKPRVAGFSLTDMTPRAAGATPAITVRHFDTLGGVTNASPSRTAGAYRPAVTAEIAPAAVLSSRIYSFGGINLMPDYEIVEPELWSGFEQVISPAGPLLPLPLVHSLNPTSDGRGLSDYKFRAVTTAAGKAAFIYSPMCPIEEERSYELEAFIENNHATYVFSTMYFRQRYYRMNSAGSLEFVNETTRRILSPIGAFAKNVGKAVRGQFTTPKGATHVVHVWEVESPFNTLDFFFSSPKLKSKEASANTAIPGGNINVPASSTGLILPISINPVYTVEGRPVLINYRFKNNSGASRAVDVVIVKYDHDTATWVPIYTIGAVTIPDQQVFSDSFMTVAQKTEKGIFGIQIVTGGGVGGATFNNRSINVIAFQNIFIEEDI